MTFVEHLSELRTRIIRSAVAVLIGFLICYALSDKVFSIIARPLLPLKQAGLITEQAQDNGQGKQSAERPPEEKSSYKAPQWTVLNPMEGFIVRLKLSAYAGLVLALPFVVYQICAFIFPGLTRSERRVVRFMLVGCAFFVIFGVAVAYFGVFPLVLPYLSHWVPEGVQLQFRMNETVSIILVFLLGFAVAFQFPMAVLVLVHLGIMSPATLKRYRRFAIVLLTVAAAVLTPPDPISMIIMLAPLVALYEMSIWMSYLVMPRKDNKNPAS